MNESQFKELFIATFIANWCASNYENHCMLDKQRELENPPVDDAKYLAGIAWEKLQEI